MTTDPWFRHRSYINHTLVGNVFRGALTPDREKYALAAILDNDKAQFFNGVERDYFEATKEKLNAWPTIKKQLMNHAKKISKEFNPYSPALAFLAEYLNKIDILWLTDVVEKELSRQFKIKEWINNVQLAIKTIDNEIITIQQKNGVTLNKLRTATDHLNKIVYSGKGYFNYGKSI